MYNGDLKFLKQLSYRTLLKNLLIVPLLVVFLILPSVKSQDNQFGIVIGEEFSYTLDYIDDTKTDWYVRSTVDSSYVNAIPSGTINITLSSTDIVNICCDYSVNGIDIKFGSSTASAYNLPTWSEASFLIYPSFFIFPTWTQYSISYANHETFEITETESEFIFEMEESISQYDPSSGTSNTYYDHILTVYSKQNGVLNYHLYISNWTQADTSSFTKLELLQDGYQLPEPTPSATSTPSSSVSSDPIESDIGVSVFPFIGITLGLVVMIVYRRRLLVV